MERLQQIVGREKSVREVAQTLRFFAGSTSASGFGAMQVTCSDESENECCDAFQKGFVHYLLPSLKFAQKSAFRLANLGGRYEWGAVRLAEDHFAAAKTAEGFKLLVSKINSHVAFEELPREAPVDPFRGSLEPTPFRFGMWNRYGRESSCCGALHSLNRGGREPYVQEIRALLESEGKDRLAVLLDERQVDPLYLPLLVAITSARLQARKIVLDAQDHLPATPTLYLIVPCVTINRHERDTEIVCGLYTVDTRQRPHEVSYYGLGDAPGDYRVDIRNNQFIVSDEHVGLKRRGRDHRALARARWEERAGDRRLTVRDDRLDRIRRDVAHNKHRHHKHARALIRAALPILAEVAPVPAAVLLFADGAVGIHHAFRVHKLATAMEGEAEAREILAEIHDKVDQLDPDRAEAMVELLVNEFGA